MSDEQNPYDGWVGSDGHVRRLAWREGYERKQDRIRTLEAELAEHEKWKPLVELAQRLRAYGSIRTDADDLYACIDRITGLRKFHADGTWHTGPACESCEKGPTDES